MLELAMVLLTAQVMAFPTDLLKVQVWELASALVMASLTGQEMDQMMVLLMVLEKAGESAFASKAGMWVASKAGGCPKAGLPQCPRRGWRGCPCRRRARRCRPGSSPRHTGN